MNDGFKPFDPEQVAFFREHWIAGYSITSIGRAMRVSPKRLVKLADKLKLRRRVGRPMELITTDMDAEKIEKMRAKNGEVGNLKLWNSPMPGKAWRREIPWSMLRQRR